MTIERCAGELAVDDALAIERRVRAAAARDHRARFAVGGSGQLG